MLWDSISTPEHVLQNVQSSLKQKYQNTHWTWTCFHCYQGSKWKRGIDSALNFTLACQNRLERGGFPGPGPAIPIFPRAPHNSIIFHQPLVPLWLSARKRKQTVRMIHDPASRCLHNSVTYWENKRKEKIKKEFFFNHLMFCSSHSVFCQGLYFQYWIERVRERGIWCLAAQGACQHINVNANVMYGPSQRPLVMINMHWDAPGLCHTPLPLRVIIWSSLSLLFAES